MLSLRRNETTQEEQAEEAGNKSQSLRQGSLSKSSEGNEEAEVDPWFPDVDFAKGVNEEALHQAGQGNHALLRPDVLDGALGRAQNYYAYTGDPAQAAASIAHGVGQGQAFEDGNKRTAYYLTHAFLHNNGYGKAVPDDDEELADHLIGYGEGTHTLDHTADALRRRMGTFSNILDPIHMGLDPTVFDDPDSPQPTLKAPHKKFITSTIFSTLERNGYEGPERWCQLVLTGSLCTYQYSDSSDCDISLFINSEQLPQWSRSEMISIMVDQADGTKLPGTPHILQNYVVDRRFKPTDLYKPGLRAGYDIASDTWIVPPERDQSHDVNLAWHDSYTSALEASDKLKRLIDFEPDKALKYVMQVHHRRHKDMVQGKGNYSDSNIEWKMFEQRGLIDQVSELTGAYIP